MDDPRTTTRTALHALAEQVPAPAVHAATGRIRLEVVHRGLATPAFGDPATTIRADGDVLSVTRGGVLTRTRLTTLRAAGELVGVAGAAPARRP